MLIWIIKSKLMLPFKDATLWSTQRPQSVATLTTTMTWSSLQSTVWLLSLLLLKNTMWSASSLLPRSLQLRIFPTGITEKLLMRSVGLMLLPHKTQPTLRARRLLRKRHGTCSKSGNLKANPTPRSRPFNQVWFSVKQLLWELKLRHLSSVVWF